MHPEYQRSDHNHSSGKHSAFYNPFTSNFQGSSSMTEILQVGDAKIL